MNDLRTVNAKFLEERLKRGQRMNDLTEELNTTEEEMINHLNKTFHSKTAKNYIKRLMSKKPTTSGKKKKNAKKVEKVEHETEMVESTVTHETEIVESIVTQGAETETKIQKTELELLLEKEDQMSKELCEKEVLHENISSQRRTLKNELREQYSEINELERNLNELLNDFNTNVDKFNSLGDEMKVLSVSIAEKRNALDALREEIDEAKKISIFVYSSGEIEFENHGSFDSTVDSSKVNELFSTLVQNEAAESLTIKSLKQLSKVLAIVEKLTAENLKFALEFDETAMKEVYDIVSQEN